MPKLPTINQPDIAIPESRACPNCPTENLKISKIPGAGFIAMHVKPDSTIGAGDGCFVSIRFQTLAELDEVLNSWPE